MLNIKPYRLYYLLAVVLSGLGSAYNDTVDPAGSNLTHIIMT